MLPIATSSPTIVEGAQYLWMFMVNISQQDLFLQSLLNSADILFDLLLQEAEGLERNSLLLERSSDGDERANDRVYFPEETAQLAFNIASNANITSLVKTSHLRILIHTLRLLMSGGVNKLRRDSFIDSSSSRSNESTYLYRLIALKGLVHLNAHSSAARAMTIASYDDASDANNSKPIATYQLISAFEVLTDCIRRHEDVSIGLLTSSIANIAAHESSPTIQYIHILVSSLLNSLSLDETLTGKLLDMGVLKYLIFMNEKSFSAVSETSLTRQTSFLSLDSIGNNTAKKDSFNNSFYTSPSPSKPVPPAGAVVRSPSKAIPTDATNLRRVSTATLSNGQQAIDEHAVRPWTSSKVVVQLEIDLERGKTLVASTLHNLMIKRVSIIPG